MDFKTIYQLDELQFGDTVFDQENNAVYVVEEGLGTNDESGYLFKNTDPNFFGQGTFLQEPEELDEYYSDGLILICRK